MVESNIEPTNIGIDSIASGIATIRVRWNKEQVERTGINEDSIALWQYDECRMKWTLPVLYSTLAEVQAYLNANYSEGEKILDWAKASKISLDDLT